MTLLHKEAEDFLTSILRHCLGLKFKKNKDGWRGSSLKFSKVCQVLYGRPLTGIKHCLFLIYWQTEPEQKIGFLVCYRIYYQNQPSFPNIISLLIYKVLNFLYRFASSCVEGRFEFYVNWTSLKMQPAKKKASYMQAVAQSNFFGLSIQSKSITNMWLTIQIQIHFSKWIDNPIQIQSQSKTF